MQLVDDGMTIGARAAKRWREALGILAPVHGVEVMLDVVGEPAPRAFDVARAMRFHIGVWSAEWDFLFCHGGRASWIRVTDIAFVHGTDDFGLLAQTTLPLEDVGSLVRRLESEQGVHFGATSLRSERTTPA